jgi:cytochrome c553
MTSPLPLHPTATTLRRGAARASMLSACALAALLAAAPAMAGNAARGEELAKKFACASCHGADYKTPIDPSYPKIAGQYDDYLFFALKSYKTEKNAVVGRNHPSMVGFAKQLSTQDMKDLAAYLSKLPGDLKVAAEPKFR